MRDSARNGFLVVREVRRSQSPRSPYKTALTHPALPQAHFLELGGSDHATPTPTVGVGGELEIPAMRTESGMGLQILLPGGIEVRGLTSIDQVLALYRGCRS